MHAVSQRSDGYIDARASEEVERGDCFDLFKTFRQDCENRGHGVSLQGMDVTAHGNLLGKRLVIFGCGYVGATLAEQALARGVRVTALTRNRDKTVVLRACGIEVVQAELASDDWHAQIAGGAEFVLNCVSSGGGGLDHYRRSYVEGMRSILRWARRAPVGTMVFTSSTSVYPQAGGVRVDETSSTEGASESARVLLEAERLLRETTERGEGTPPTSTSVCQRWFILRLAGIYGPARHHLLDQLLRGEKTIAGRGDHRLNLAHRDDIAAAIWAALTVPPEVANEIFNVADGHPARKAEIMAWLAVRLGRPVPHFTGEAGRSRRVATPDRLIGNARAMARLGWHPRYPDFQAGYDDILQGISGECCRKNVELRKSGKIERTE